MDLAKQIEVAADFIAQGKLVAFPTETVFGLGANARDTKACERIYQLKNRPQTNPLIVHVGSTSAAKKIAEFNQDAEKLAMQLWPNAISLVLPKKENCPICEVASANLDTIAIRIPKHPVALALLQRCNLPIAAPSANLSNYISATRAEHVRDDFEARSRELGDILMILDDAKNNPSTGLESTIIDLTKETPIILRQGCISKAQIENVLEKSVDIALKNAAITAPGMFKKHYAPRAPLRLNALELRDHELGLDFGNAKFAPNRSLNLSERGNLPEAAQNLYSMLRELDKRASTTGANSIALSPIPLEGIGLAINDRIKRAAEK